LIRQPVDDIVLAQRSGKN